MKLVITMSRRFGTGASIIATELSKRLDIPVYDKAYIEEQLNDRMYESEAEAIRKLAEHPCIILGRCASDILKDKMNVLNIFVCADKEDRIRRIMEKENLDYNGAKERVETTDEERASYYYEHTGKSYGKIYKLKMNQFRDVLKQEQGGKSYDAIIYVGEYDGLPIFTFTASHKRDDLESPSKEYRNVIKKGILETYANLTVDDVERYFLDCENNNK